MRALAVLCGAALLALAGAACNGGAGEPPFLIEISPIASETPTPTPVATPTATPEPTPIAETGDMDGFRAFAAQIEVALAERDGSLFASRAERTEITCAGGEGLGPCSGQAAGTVIVGVWHGLWRTDAVGLVAPEEIDSDFESFLSAAAADESDTFGGGEAALYAIASTPAGIFTGEESFYAILTAVLDDQQAPERRIIAYQFAFRQGNWKLVAAIEAGALFEEWLLGECADCYDIWERWEGAP